MTETTMTIAGFNVGFDCDTGSGYTGTSSTATVCGGAGTAYGGLLGCDATCIAPTSTPGYLVTQTTMTIDGFTVGFACDTASGYHGTPSGTATVCTAAGTAYSGLSGCVVGSCTVPSSLTGYTMTTGGSGTDLELGTQFNSANGIAIWNMSVVFLSVEDYSTIY